MGTTQSISDGLTLGGQNRPIAATAPEIDFAKLVGRRGWSRLAPAIRRRFSAVHAIGKVVRYEGQMSEVSCSVVGWLFAQAGRLIGTPITPFAGRNVPTTVNVFRVPGNGICWQRIYRFSGRRAIVVSSVKRVSRTGRMMECAGAGIGMWLEVFEQSGALHFRSTSFFWKIGPWRLPLPGWLTPGTAHVIHTDRGGGRFRFTLSFRHPFLGTTFFQDGLFEDPGVQP